MSSKSSHVFSLHLFYHFLHFCASLFCLTLHYVYWCGSVSGHNQFSLPEELLDPLCSQLGSTSVEIFSASLFPRCAAAGVAWYRQLWPQLLTRSPLLPSSLFCRRLNYSLLCWVNFHLQKPKFQASL